MAAFELVGAKWGTPALGTGGGQVTWSFATTLGTFYAFDASIGEAVYQNLIRDAFQAWEDVANIDFVEIADSPASDIRLGWDAIDGPWDTVGEAAYSYYIGASYNELSEAEIRFDVAETWGTAKHYVSSVTSFYAVALHEIGHAIGLDHTDDVNTIMYPMLSEEMAPAAGDIAGIQLLYGAAAAPPPPSGGFTGTGGNDVYSGSGADELIYGFAGNDHLTGQGGNDIIDGGAGTDMAHFAGRLADYTLPTTATGTIADLRAGAPDGTDELISMERLGFLDANVAFDLTGNAGQAYRLYEAAFDRTPDLAGVGYWIRQLDAGRGDLNWVAANFIASQEFRDTYGTPSSVSNLEFLNLIYNNVLDRGAEGAGLDYWMNEMSHGLPRERVLAFFSESAENQANVAPAIADGIVFV